MPTHDEIRNAVWECDPSKAPGYDGFNLKFIKELLREVSDDFVKCILDFFVTSRMSRKLNMTWVTLIRKVDDGQEIKDYRPISMVGCIYKVIVKILANRLKGVMNGLVGETQTAFVQGRQILDGALIACETVQSLKRKKQSAALVKLDFHKAFDPVRWTFVDEVLKKMGFGCVWKLWI